MRTQLRVFNSRKLGPAEVITMLLYTVSVSIVSAFHEPWFDEAQAWLIARDGTLYDIFFTIPHYEGHPPLWYLILYPFANLGAPYELSLKIISIAIASAAMFLLIFKSPFPRIIRIVLPFTYFFFYQYAVIARPYGLMILAFFLIALAYPRREKKPVRFALSVAFLSATCAYGLLFAGALGLVWLIEALGGMQGTLKERLRGFIRGPVFRSMLGLLFFLMLLAAEIMPRSDTYAIEKLTDDNHPVLMMFYNFFGLPVEAIYADTIGSYTMLNRYHFNPWVAAAEIAVGVLMISFILYYGYRKKRVLLFVIPAAFFSVFCAFVYIYLHHIGLYALLIVFWFWVCLYTKRSDERKMYRIRHAVHEIFGPEMKKAMRRFSVFGLVLALAVGCVYSVSSSVDEISRPYGYGRGVYDFINRYDLEDCRIMTSWEEGNTNEISYAGGYLPYFRRDIVCNVNIARNHVSYDTHIYTSDEENEENLAAWKALGKPDVLIGRVNLSELYHNQEVTEGDYVLVAEIPYDFIWKSSYFYGAVPIYVRKEIVEEKNIPVLYDPSVYESMEYIIQNVK